MRTTNSPCAADALFGTKTITVNGKNVGIARLCDAIAEVRSMGLHEDQEIRAALLKAVEENNYIPEPLRDEYSAALIAQYRVDGKKGSGGL